MEKNIINIESNAAILSACNCMETAIANIRREKDQIHFTEILDFGHLQTERTMHKSWEHLYSVHADARAINSTAPAALFQLILDGETLTFDLFETAKTLKAKRSNSLFDLINDYTPAQIALLAQQAKAYYTEENSLTCFQMIANIPLGTEFRIANPQTGFTYGMVISSFKDGNTFAITEEGLCGFFNAKYEIAPIPAKLREAILKAMPEWHTRTQERREHLEGQIEKRKEREAATAKKNAERIEAITKKINSYGDKYKMELPAKLPATLPELQKLFAELSETAEKIKAANAEKKALDKINNEAAKLAKKWTLSMMEPLPATIDAANKHLELIQKAAAKAETAKAAADAKAKADGAKAETAKPAKATKATKAEPAKTNTPDLAMIAQAAATAIQNAAAPKQTGKK